MRKQYPVVFLGMATSFLAACGGSSTSTNGFDSLLSQGNNLVNTAPSNFTTPAEMPTSGTATYAGFAGFSEDPTFDPTNPEEVSAVNLAVDFAAAPGSGVTGSFSNFWAIDPTTGDKFPLHGTIAIDSSSGGFGGISGSQLTAFGQGTISDDNGASALWIVDVNGLFLGSTVPMVAGTADGTYDFGGGPIPVYGGFIAKR